MAMMDYGAIVLKNGKLVTNDLFTDMKDAVGWEDDGIRDYNGKLLNLKNNYFTYIGDSENTLAFYKGIMTHIEEFDFDDDDPYFVKSTEFFASTNYTWSKWTDYIGGSKCVVTKRNGYYVCHWNYKGDKYKVYFGYGVDINSYKKWRIVNYYRSIPFYFNKVCYFFENKFCRIFK